MGNEWLTGAISSARIVRQRPVGTTANAISPPPARLVFVDETCAPNRDIAELEGKGTNAKQLAVGPISKH
jgi:hypothetical protein